MSTLTAVLPGTPSSRAACERPERRRGVAVRPARLSAVRPAAPAARPVRRVLAEPMVPTVPVTGRGGLRLTARGRAVVVLAVLLLLLGAFAAGRTARSSATETVSSGPSATRVVVQPGDTLWTMAHRLAPSRDPRDVVAQIRRLNHLASAQLQAGQTLLLPSAA